MIKDTNEKGHSKYGRERTIFLTDENWHGTEANQCCLRRNKIKSFFYREKNSTMKLFQRDREQ